MEPFRRWTTRLLERIAIVGVGILGVAIVLVVADIALRAVFNHSITGTVDVTQLCVMAAVFWTIPYAFIRDGHVGITLATDWLPRRGVAVLDMLAALAGLAFVLLMTRYGWEQAIRSLDYGDRSQTIGIPMIWYWGFLLSGGVLSCLATLVVAAHHLLVAVGWQPSAPAERN